MVESPSLLREVRGLMKRLGKDLLGLGQVHMELLAVEIQEERERWLNAMLLALAGAAFGLLAGFTFTLAVMVLLWEHSPGYVLIGLGLIYAIVGFVCHRRLLKMRHEWSVLPETVRQLQKDWECLDQCLD